jgi:hypothetical protein
MARSHAQTGLTLPFDGSLTGTRGQTPSSTSGVTFSAGKVNQAAAFDSSDVLEYPSATNIDSQEGTLEFWYKPNWNPGTGRGYAFCVWGGGGGMVFVVDGGPNLRAIFNRWGAEVGVIANVSGWHAGEWHHIAFTWSSSQLLLRLYLDGALKDQWHLSAPLPSISGDPLRIGSEAGGSDADGLMDEVSISTRAKTSGEILDSYLRTVGITGLRFDPENLTLWKTWWRKPRLFAETPVGSVELPHDAYPLTSSDPSVGAIRSDNYILAANVGTCDISATFGGLTATMHLTVPTPALPEQDEPIDPVLSTPMAGHIWEMPVVIVRFIPTADGVHVDPDHIGPDGSWVTVEMARGWIDKFEIRTKNGLELRSRFRAHSRPEARPSLGYRVLKIITFYEPMPPYMDFQPDASSHQPDYDQILRRINAEHWVTEHNAKEFWIWGYHAGGIYPVESNMSSPTTGDISNSFRLNDLPVFDRTYTLYGYNFMRTQTEALHNHGHQIEAILSHVASRQDGVTDLFWVNFCGFVPGVGMGTGRGGTCHHPTNTNLDYDYLNEALVLSDCEDWTPDYSGQKKTVNMHRWRDLVFEWPGDPGFNDPSLWSTRAETQYLIYWWQNMPGWDNGIRYGASEEMTNWWKFTGDWDGSIARLAAEGGLHGPKQPSLSSLVVDPASGTPGASSSLAAVLLRRSNGSGVALKPVQFAIDGTAVGTDDTSASGQAVLPYIVGSLGAGAHEVQAQFAGDADLAAASGAATLTVSKAGTSVQTADCAGVVAEWLVLRAADLSRNTDNAVLAGQTITFKVDGSTVGTGVTDAGGDATLTWTVTDGPVTRTVRVEYAGDGSYNPCSAEAALVVDTNNTRTATKLYSVDRSAVGADPVALRGFLYRKSDSAGLSGKTLSFKIAGTEVGTAVTAVGGAATFTWVVTAGPASRQIMVVFGGDETFGPALATANLTVRTYDTKVLAPGRSGEIAESIVLKAYLYRVPGSSPVPGKRLDLAVDGTTIGSATTNTQGRALITWTVPDTLAPGSHVFAGVWPGDAGYRASSSTGTLMVDKGVSYLWLASRSIARGGSAYLRAYLRRLPDYAWLPGRTVQFTLDGVVLGTGVTDSSGMAPYLYTAPTGMATGAHPMEAEFAGDSKYLENGSAATLTVL